MTDIAPRAPRASAADAGDLDPPEAQERRQRLVDELIAIGDARSKPVIEALRRVPRHLFVPPTEARYAYDNRPLVIGHEQTISQPTVVAMMTEALDLDASSRVLEIGTGSAYQTAILSLLAAEVWSIERIPWLAAQAEDRLQRLGCANVHVRFGDGYEGWAERAPFDRIVITAAPPAIPGALLDQLADGGILIAPIGSGQNQDLVRIHKAEGRLHQESLGAVRFVPMLPGRSGSTPGSAGLP
ncbi:protein-L-isoaspartate(D-aspartate) O-methyltransferase [Chondromyces apiculatus]|uniref:Protein-L-isoaspartate O-methyltransferase n=1 Tax=Chondromyces apiculatus DSM 436 TaxID=1192034 RepID=A0A017TDT7_9BACT|nr:protein-L-isoaspartate(D-aspartate) O-methyltransferase [Chondromyces apiculatus]EYF07463.1 Protein-L-isoaspartate O-methyltransferase [Chondromyces apiculatus DSM 436]